MVYFIQASDERGFIKIGYSRDVYKRLSALQCGSPVGLVILGVIHGSYGTEAAIHKLLKKYRIHSEWFLPSKLVLHYISVLLDVEKSLEDFKKRRVEKYLIDFEVIA